MYPLKQLEEFFMGTESSKLNAEDLHIRHLREGPDWPASNDCQGLGRRLRWFIRPVSRKTRPVGQLWDKRSRFEINYLI